MGHIVSTETQRSAAQDLAAAVSEMDGITAEVLERSSGTSPRNVVVVNCPPSGGVSWPRISEILREWTTAQ